MTAMKKYVFSSTLEHADWNNTTIVRGDALSEGQTQAARKAATFSFTVIEEFWNEALQRIKARAESAAEEIPERANHTQQYASGREGKDARSDPPDRRDK